MSTQGSLRNDKPAVSHAPTRSPLAAPRTPCHDRLLNACVPLPLVHDHGDLCHTTLTSIHPLLSSPDPSIMFDLHHQPSTIVIPPHALAQPATVPPLPCMCICSHLLPWSIVVLPSQPHTSNSFVSVFDVLHTLHRTLSFVASEEELNELTSEIRSQVHAAYERRLESHSDRPTREWETRLGIRRIDILMDHTRFQGLSIVGDNKDVILLDLC